MSDYKAAPKRFATRVWVCNANRFLYHVTSERAAQLISQEVCQPMVEAGDKRIWRLLLVHTPGPTVAPPHFPQLTDYQGRSTVYREKTYAQNTSKWAGHKVYAHAFIHPDDRWVYVTPPVAIRTAVSI